MPSRRRGLAARTGGEFAVYSSTRSERLRAHRAIRPWHATTPRCEGARRRFRARHRLQPRRTAENRTAIRYAARACIDSDLTPAAFYAEYAKALGIGEAAIYRQAMEDLDDADAFCREKLFNIGFCFVGCSDHAEGARLDVSGWKKALVNRIRG